MSTFDYQEMIDTVNEMLAEFGNPVTLTRTGTPVVDPVEGTTTPGAEVVTQPLGLILAINEDYATRWGSGIAIGDRALLLQPGDRPQAGDLVTLEGQQWTVVTVDVTAPDGTDLLYEVLVRP